MQRTLLGHILDRTMESAWLAAVVAVPALINVYSVRGFEGDKVPFLRSLALVVVALWIARRMEATGETLPPRAVLRQPVIVAATLVVACTLISNAFSIAPDIAFWGSYERVQGTYVLLAYATIFFAFISTAGRPQVDRLVTAVLIASLAPGLYALVQVYGVDPIGWDVEMGGRVHSTAGNPIFLGAFLILVIPLALARLIEAIESRHYASSAVYLGCLWLNAVALACTQSRGPAVALGIGLGVFILATVARRRLRRALYTAGIVAVTTIVATLFVRVSSLPRQDAELMTALGAGTARVRLLIWEGTANLIASQPEKIVLGYGLDTFRLVFPPVFPPELARLEKSDVTPDRAHNDTFDTIVHLGVVGLAARLFLIVAVLAVLLETAGVLRKRRTFYGLAAGGVLAGVLVSATVGLPFLGIAVGAGLLAALGACLMLHRATAEHPAPETADPSRELLGLGLLAAATAHIAEIQVGIPTATTLLYFWLFAAAAVALRRSPATQSRHDGDAALMLGSCVAVLLSTVMFAVYTPSLDLRASGVIAALAGASWLAALAIAGASAAFSSPRLVGVANFTLASLGGALAFALPYSRWINARPTRGGESVLSDYITHFASVWYCGVFVLIAGGGLVSILLGQRRGMAFSSRPWLSAIGVPLLLVAAGWAVVTTNLAASRADMYAKLGALYERRDEWELAAAMDSRALALQDRESRYALDRARVLTSFAVEVAKADPGAVGTALTDAERAAELAWRANPLEPDNAALLARVNRRLAAVSPRDRSLHVDEAERSYKLALVLSPRRATLWQEYAGFLLENDRPEKAIDALGHAVELDDRDAESYALLAHADLKLERYQDALAAYEILLEVHPDTVSGLTGKALALTRLGRPLEAIETNLLALEIAPNDLIVRRNLAALYRDQGQLDAARDHALAGLQISRGDERLLFDQLVGQIEALRAKPILTQ